MGFLFETFPASNQPRRESGEPAGGVRMDPFKARRSVAAADVRLAPLFASQHWPADFWGLPANAGWAVWCIGIRKNDISFLPLTCICARWRDSAQRPTFCRIPACLCRATPRQAGTHDMRLGPCVPAARWPRLRALRCERGTGEQRGRDR